MKNNEKKLMILASFEDASILRKFAVIFIIASIVPLALLYYIYLENENHNLASISSMSLTIAMILMAIGVLVGYISIRSLLVKVIAISKNNREAIEKLLSTKTIEEIDKGEDELVVLSRSFSAVTDQLEKNIRDLKATQKTLQSVMQKVGQGISHMGDIKTFLQLIVETMCNALDGKAGALLILNSDKTELMIKTVEGVDFDLNNFPSLKLKDHPALAAVITEKRPMVLSLKELNAWDAAPLDKLSSPTVLCAPLVHGENISGLLMLSKKNKVPEAACAEDIALLFTLASQTAIAWENSKLNFDIEKTYFETISALALAVDAKDKYSRGHLDRVADYSLLIGKRLGLDEKDLNTLRDAARLHDLGKIGVPDDILKKEGVLSDEEWSIMRRHPEIGENIIKPVRSLSNLCDLIRHHHEKLDGTGYPDGLKGDQITRLVRILSIADVFDALITERSYRPKNSRQDAARIMRSMSDHLDQSIVEIFLDELKIQA